MVNFSKECKVCKNACNQVNSVYKGEEHVSETQLVYWFKCSCGNPLAISASRLDYSRLNEIKLQKKSFRLDYSFNKIGA